MHEKMVYFYIEPMRKSLKFFSGKTGISDVEALRQSFLAAAAKDPALHAIVTGKFTIFQHQDENE